MMAMRCPAQFVFRVEHASRILIKMFLAALASVGSLRRD